MFDGPFNQKISNSKESLPEEYFHDYSFIQSQVRALLICGCANSPSHFGNIILSYPPIALRSSQRFLMTLQRADVHSSLEGQVEGAKMRSRLCSLRYFSAISVTSGLNLLNFCIALTTGPVNLLSTCSFWQERSPVPAILSPVYRWG